VGTAPATLSRRLGTALTVGLLLALLVGSVLLTTVSRVPRPSDTPAATAISRALGPVDTTFAAGVNTDTGVGPDSGDWPTLLHDSYRTGGNEAERTLAASNLTDIQQIWQAYLSWDIRGSLVEASGVVFAGTEDGYLNAMSADNGTLLWKTLLATGGVGAHPLPRPGWVQLFGADATPTVVANTVYAVGVGPTLFAINATSGAIQWHLDLGNLTGSSPTWSDYYVWSSPLVLNGSVYVGLTDKGAGAPLVRGAIVQIGVTDHAVDHVFWTAPVNQSGAGVWASPAADPEHDAIWVTTGYAPRGTSPYADSVLELDASNISRLLEYARPYGEGPGFNTSDGPILFDAPGGRPLVVVADAAGQVFAFNRTSMDPAGATRPAWTLALPYPETQAPAIHQGTLYFGSGELGSGSTTVVGNLTAVNGTTGAIEWNAIDGGFPGATVANGLVLGPGLTAFVASNGSELLSEQDAGLDAPIVAHGEILLRWNNMVAAFALPLGGTFTASAVSASAATTYAFDGAPSGGRPPYTVAWNFGDGASAEGSHVVHAYGLPGNFTVTMTVTDSRDSTTASAQVVTAAAPLILDAQLSSNPVPVGGTAWINLTVGGAVGPVGITWSGLPPEVGVGAPSSTSLEFRPLAQGRYDISASVSEDSGQYAEVSFPTLWVDGPTAFTILPSPPQGPSPLSVTLGTTSPFGPPSGTFNWSFGDGQYSSSASPSHTFAAPGRYTVQSTVTYPGGTSALSQTTELVFSPFVATAPGEIEADLGWPTHLEVNASGGSGTYTVTWAGLPLGCPTENSSTVVCSPDARGTFAVSVSVTDRLGGIRVVPLELIVHDAIGVKATVTSVAPGSCATPQSPGLATVGVNVTGGTSPYAVVWSGPSGTFGGDSEASWAIPAGGAIPVQVTVGDRFGQTGSDALWVSVPPSQCGPTAASGGLGLPLAPVGFLGLASIASLAVVGLWIRRRRRR